MQFQGDSSHARVFTSRVDCQNCLPHAPLAISYSFTRWQCEPATYECLPGFHPLRDCILSTAVVRSAQPPNTAQPPTTTYQAGSFAREPNRSQASVKCVCHESQPPSIGNQRTPRGYRYTPQRCSSVVLSSRSAPGLRCLHRKRLARLPGCARY